MTDLIGVLVATLAAFAVGMVWYSVLFGKRWQILMNYTEGHMGAPEAAPTGKGMGMTGTMVGSFVSTFVLVYALSYFMGAIGVENASEAVVVGLIVSLGFVATVLANSMWYERRPLELYLINAGHYVAAIIVAALVLVYF